MKTEDLIVPSIRSFTFIKAPDQFQTYFMERFRAWRSFPIPPGFCKGSGSFFSVKNLVIFASLMKHFKSISELHKTNGYAAPAYPLLSLFNLPGPETSIGNSKFTSDFYMIAFKRIKSGTFLYGKTKYDHDNGSMSFVKPRQVVEISNIELTEKAFIVFIHEDFLLNTTCIRK